MLRIALIMKYIPTATPMAGTIMRGFTSNKAHTLVLALGSRIEAPTNSRSRFSWLIRARERLNKRKM